MSFQLKQFLVSLLLSFIIFQPTTMAVQKKFDDPSALDMTLDGLVIRPLSLGATLIGGTVFTVTLPFTIFANTAKVWDTLVADPFFFTFTRPLGEYDDWQEKQE